MSEGKIEMAGIEMMKRQALALAAVLLVAGPVWAGADLSASRTSGVAPLYVHFDATRSTSSSAADPFHQMYFHWDFGDTGSGNWGPSGLSRNEASGPIAAHVFEKPGTYTVKLDTIDPAGNRDSRSVTISVSDPNAVFSGAKTTCVSASGNFSGCPSGANRVRSSSFATAAGYAKTGTRVLLARGDTFTGRGRISQTGPGLLGAYGSGAKPVITKTNSNAIVEFGDRGKSVRDWRIMDLEVAGVGTQYSVGLSAEGFIQDVLVLRTEVHDTHTGVMMNWRRIAAEGGPHLFDRFAIVDSVVRDLRGGPGGNGAYMAVHRLAVLGSTFSNSTDSEHLMRLNYAGKAVLSSNRFRKARDRKVHLKLHAMDVSLKNSFAERDSNQIVISDNVVEGGEGGWSFALGPQNNFTDERVYQAIIERNRFIADTVTKVHNIVWASHVTVRNNVFDSSAGLVVFTRAGIEPPPVGNQSYDNCAAPASSCAVFASGGTAPAPTPTSSPPPPPPPDPTLTPPAAPVLLP